MVEIVARNIGNATLMSAEDNESLQETLHLFSTRANAAHILRGREEARDGPAQPVDLDEQAARFEALATAAEDATAEAEA